MQATCKKFYEYCEKNGIAIATRNFELRYDTNIPRQVGDPVAFPFYLFSLGMETWSDTVLLVAKRAPPISCYRLLCEEDFFPAHYPCPCSGWACRKFSHCHGDPTLLDGLLQADGCRYTQTLSGSTPFFVVFERLWDSHGPLVP